jgi:DNA (cytosine-5)-methyltransferase 1
MSWLISKTLMNSLCSQGQAVESLAGNFSDGEQSVPLNGNNIPQAYCAPDKMTGFSRLSRFGMTYKPLTDDLGEELCKLYREAFLVRTFPLPEKELELKENAPECGEKWHGSFVKWDPDSCSWKTHQCLLLGDLDEFSETWPQWGLMRDGECWEQRTLEQTIRGTESGLSPNGVDSFHTPNTTGLDGGSNSRKALKKRQEKFPTPTCHNSNEKGSPSEFKRQSPGLGTVVLVDKNKTGGILNPTWVEWLMGWPLGWTDLKPLETDKFHCVQQQPGES